MKVILCGYNWTGCKALEILLNSGNEVFVYTHESENCIADLEGLCLKKGQDYSLDKIDAGNLPFIPDIICSIYYRYIISSEVIDAVNGRIFNLHPALLPLYRGCSSLTWAMINGDDYCGYTYHYIDYGCDTGNILVQKKIRIEDYDTQLTLYNRVMFEAMDDFSIAFEMVCRGESGVQQQGKSSYYKRGCPYEGCITTDMDDRKRERFIRAMIYPPYPAAQYNGMTIETIKQLHQCGDN